MLKMREIFARFARKSSSRIFLAVNHTLSYGCYNKNGLEKAWSWTLVIANQFIGSKLRNKVVTNKSWFIVFQYFQCTEFRVNMSCLVPCMLWIWKNSGALRQGTVSEANIRDCLRTQTVCLIWTKICLTTWSTRWRSNRYHRTGCGARPGAVMSPRRRPKL